MAASRYFWLPWRSKHAGVVGSRTRMDTAPWDPITQTTGTQNQNGNAGLFREVNLSTAMGCYAVTQDPARVPLVETNLYATADLNDASGYPRDPWYAWNATDCAMKPPGGSPLDHPELGPWYWAMSLKPWSFFVYELNAAMTLRGQYFISDYNAHPYNSWFIGRCHAGTAVWLQPYGGGNVWTEALGQHGAGPVGAYVLRPSTGNIVGWLYQRYTRGGGGPHVANYGAGTAQRSSPFSGPGPQNKSYRSAYREIGGNYYWGGAGTDVVVLPGDLIVWEWWVSGYLGCGSAQQYHPHPRIETTVEITVGGGLAGQPLTLDAGIPNWAPAWGCPHPDTPAMPGIEPEPMTWLTRAAPNGNGIELHFEDGSPEVTMTKARPSKGGIELTFGGAVQLATPVDLGTPASGITVLGVTSLSDTVKQVDLARTGPAIAQPTGIVGVAAGETQDFGEDVSTYPDLDPNFILQGGNRVVAETILRMLETPRGSLVYAPDRGYDVRALFGEAITQRTLAQAKRSIEAECLKDERVEAVATALDFDAATSTLQIRLEVTTAAGPFQLTLAVTAVSLTILDGGK